MISCADLATASGGQIIATESTVTMESTNDLSKSGGATIGNPSVLLPAVALLLGSGVLVLRSCGAGSRSDSPKDRASGEWALACQLPRAARRYREHPALTLSTMAFCAVARASLLEMRAVACALRLHHLSSRRSEYYYLRTTRRYASALILI